MRNSEPSCLALDCTQECAGGHKPEPEAQEMFASLSCQENNVKIIVFFFSFCSRFFHFLPWKVKTFEKHTGCHKSSWNDYHLYNYSHYIMSCLGFPPRLYLASASYSERPRLPRCRAASRTSRAAFSCTRNSFSLDTMASACPW